jgi:hypothetical protein
MTESFPTNNDNEVASIDRGDMLTTAEGFSNMSGEDVGKAVDQLAHDEELKDAQRSAELAHAAEVGIAFMQANLSNRRGIRPQQSPGTGSQDRQD